jgi:hypothetical protein
VQHTCTLLICQNNKQTHDSTASQVPVGYLQSRCLLLSVCLCRFNPIDARCAMELDDIKPESWRKLTAATSEYCSQPAIAAQFEQLAQLLTANHGAAVDHQAGAAAGVGAGQASSRRHVQQQQWQQQDVAAVGAPYRQFGSNFGQAAGSSLGLGVERSGAAQQQQGRTNWQAIPGIPMAPPRPFTSGERQRVAGGDLNSAEQDNAAAQAEPPAAAAAAGVAGSQGGSAAAAPRLLYQKDVLLVEAPRGVAASAAAAATAAGAAALSCVRQQQQQELVGRMLAATLPQRFLQVCDLSAAVADSSQSPARQDNWQVQSGVHQQQPEVLGNSPKAADSGALAQEQQQDGPTEPGRLALVNSRPAERRSSYAASSPAAAAAAASPKTPGSWLGYLFPWQAASGIEQQQEAAAGDGGQGRSSDNGQDTAALGGAGSGAARSAGKYWPAQHAAYMLCIARAGRLCEALLHL